MQNPRVRSEAPQLASSQRSEVLVVGKGGTTIKSRALLDSGSDSNIVTEKLASKLNLKLHQVDLPISGLNDIQTRVKYIVSTNIVSRVNSFSSSILDSLVVPKVTSNLPITEVDYRSWLLPANVKLADPSFHNPGGIGNEIFFDLIKQGRLKLGKNEATLTETELGWVVGGSVQIRKSKECLRVCQLNHQDEFEMASKRLDKLLISLAKDPAKREQYFGFMAEYLSLGHMEEITEDTRYGYYIPHHAVFKATSSTTKVRVVFDASASTTSEVSLNDTVCVGPTVQSDLQTIILRFCAHPVVLTADVPKMYRQVWLSKNDRKFQKIVWVDKNGVRKVYELKTVTYGVVSSPHHATKALIQLATDEGKDFPLAEQVIRYDSYIDDFLTGGKSAEEVLKIYRELTSLLQRGGFGVHKFCSNNPEVLKAIPEELQEKFVSFEDTGINNTIRTLGLIWNPLEDYFAFFIQPISEHTSSTKRMVLSDIGRLFDPLGFLGPVITAAKLVMQNIWRLGLNWDEELPEELLQEWTTFRQQLPVVNEMHKQRCVIPENAVRIELHGFSDASMRAYGAVMYTRCVTADGTISVNLVASKSRVAPLKPMTIPRLELCGAKLLADLTTKVVASMRIHFDDVKLWCDSSIVLCWLKKSPSALNQFVSNRVATIVELTQGYQWNYIRSESNPADVISRACLGVVLRFIDYVVHKKRDVTSISANEVTSAERAMFLVLQKEVFGDLLKGLKAESSKRHGLSNLAPFIGLDGLIRVGGRLKYSAIPYDGKHQVLLPAKHHVTEALIRKLHEENQHVGQGGLLSIVRERYWPLRVSSGVEDV
ncbi:uncharacterized protein LOC135712264 [Ochlerotatus camptorhynchus]|uniref:uncharacterized protein LOC135712264 n=1 Tax=Ochlerotatus camptorhynchus TaxID=644619 RepID=UPI0031E3DA7A